MQVVKELESLGPEMRGARGKDRPMIEDCGELPE